MNSYKLLAGILFLLLFAACSHHDKPENDNPRIPASYSNLHYDECGRLVMTGNDGTEYKQFDIEPQFKICNFMDCMTAEGKKIYLDLGMENFHGTIYFGLYPLESSEDIPGMKMNMARYPVFFKRSAKIRFGKATIDMSIFYQKRYDIGKLTTVPKGRLGYRIMNSEGRFVYDGKVDFKNVNGIEIDTYITSGPYLNQVTETSAVIEFSTNKECSSTISVRENNGQGQDSEPRIFSSTGTNKHHEIEIDGLEPGKEYIYTVKALFPDYITKALFQKYDSDSVRSLDFIPETYFKKFKTNPRAGSRQKFTFAYVSDSREGPAGGERSIFGVNAYIMKKMAAVARQNNARFAQFTGDMIDGYLTCNKEQAMQYLNWKRALEPYWQDMPWYVGMGNHEALVYAFGEEGDITIDKFPYDKYSAEAEFAKFFSNFENGPVSEDGSKYDPSEDIDFPSYKENVYYYTYDNVAMIVLNSDYWYAPSLREDTTSDGNLHGYLMDNQMKWLSKTLQMLEKDGNIDHVFVTLHTPVFPNGGHAKDDMWYHGNNRHRARIAGESVEDGVIERRDAFLDEMVNKSSKVVAVLCGDEHNYSRLRINDDMPRYLEDYKPEKVKLNREIWQITNGAAGAPYYSQEDLIWSDNVEKFSAQYALVLFHIDGKSVEVEVINPDTLEEIETAKLK
jgi:hypothetical protein